MRKSVNGLSLIELLVTTTIVAVGMAITVPNASQFWQRHQAAEAILQLSQALLYARREAINLGEKVIVCGTENFKNCSKYWSKGYLVVAMNSMDHTIKPQDILRIYPLTKGKLIWQGFGNYDHIAFMPTGLTDYQNGTFMYCYASAPMPAAGIIVSQSGRARIATAEDNLPLCNK